MGWSLSAGSGTTIGGLNVILSGTSDSYKQMMIDAAKSTEVNMKKIEKTIDQALETVVDKAKQTGKAIEDYIVKPLMDLGKKALDSFGNFEFEMTKATAIMGVSAEQAKEMSKAALELSGRTLQGPVELARGYYYLASAGYDAAQAIKMLPIVANFATAGSFPLQKAAELLVGVQTSMGLKSADAERNATQLQRISDVLAKASTLSQTSIEEMATAMTRAGGAMRSYGVSLEQAAALTAALATQNMKATLAGNTETRMYTLLAGASRDAALAHQKYGLRIFDDTTGKMRNMSLIFKDLERILGNVSAEERSARLAELGIKPISQKFVLPLLGQSDFMAKVEAEAEKAVREEATKTIAQKQLGTFKGLMTQFYNELEVIVTEIGGMLAPVAGVIIRFFQGLIDGVSRLPDWLKKSVVYIGAFIAGVYSMNKILGTLGIAINLTWTALSNLYKSMTMIGTIGLANPFMTFLTIIGTAVAGAFALGAALEGLINDYNGVNEAIARTNQLVNDQIKANEKVVQKSLRAAADKSEAAPKESINILNEQYELQKKQRDQYQALYVYYSRLYEINPTAKAKSDMEAFGKLTKAAQGEMDRLRQSMEDLQTVVEENPSALPKVIQKINKKLQDQYWEVGKTQSQISLKKLEDSGFAQEDLALTRILQRSLDMHKKGTDLTKKFEDPTIKYTQKIDELNSLVSAGAITFDVYTNAVADAQKELDKAGKMADKVREKFDAAEVGSAEALQRYAQYLDAIRIVERPSSTVPIFQNPQSVPEGYRTQQELKDAAERALGTPTNPSNPAPVSLNPEAQQALLGIWDVLKQMAQNTGTGLNPLVPLVPAGINP